MIKEGFQDEIHTNVEIVFSWRDRLRILFGKTAHCDVRTQTENLPGRCESKTHAWVEPIYQRPLPPLGQAEFTPKSDKRIRMNFYGEALEEMRINRDLNTFSAN